MALPKPNLYISLVTLFFFGFFGASHGQVTLSGPICVTTGITYQYDMTGSWSDTSSFQFCITGGIIVDSGSNCINGKPVSFVRVSWNDSITNGHLALNSSVGNASLDVGITQALQGGSIDSASHYQAVDSTQVPATVTCSGAAYGNCSPSYTYQWQQSADMVSWADITSATSSSLTFTNPVLQIMYYRRKVTENGSGAIAYSNEAAVVPR